MTTGTMSRSDRLHYTFGLGVYKLLSIVSALVVAYLLQAEGYGLLSFAQASATMVASVGSLAIPTLLTREISQRQSDRAVVFRSSLIITSFCVVIATVLLLLFTIFFVGLDDLPQQLERLGVGVVLGGAALYALGQVISDLVAAALLSQMNSRAWSRWLVVQSGVVTLVSILAALSDNAAIVLFASGGSQFLISLVGIWMLRKQGFLDQVDLGRLKSETFRQLRLAVTPGLSSQTISIAVWFTTAVLAAQENGVVLIGWYTIAYKVASGLAFLPEAAVTARTTLIYENVKTDRFYLLIRQGIRDSIIIGILAIIVVGLSAHLITSLGEGYAGAESLILAMALIIPLRALQSLFSVTILALNKSRIWSISYLFGSVAYLVGLVSVWVLGGVGVAIAAILSYGIQIIIMFLCVPNKKNLLATHA